MFCFALFAEAFQVSQLSFLRQLLHAFNGADLEFLPKERHFLRSHGLQTENFEQGHRIFLQQFVAQGVVAGLQNLANVRGHTFADAWQFLQLLLVLGDVLDAFVHAVQQLRHFLVAAVAADNRSVNFQQLRRLTQNSCDFSIFHVSSSWVRPVLRPDC